MFVFEFILRLITLKHHLTTVAFLLILSIGFSQNRVPPPPCDANDNSGAGGVIGNGIFLSYTETNINLAFSAQQSQVLFNDVLVMYIATSAPGRNVLDETVDDAADGYRTAITNSDAYGFGSTITFPSGFEVSYAIAIDTNSGGLYSIPSSGNIGNGELNYISSVNSTLTSNTQTGFEISFNPSDIGIASDESFYFVALYVGHNGYTYDEGYGNGILAGTQGDDDVNYTSARLLNGNPGCQTVLSINENNNNIMAYYSDNALHINGINAKVNIVAYDIMGREVVRIKQHVNGATEIPMNLLKNQLQFIVIESSNKRKLLKVLPTSK